MFYFDFGNFLKFIFNWKLLLSPEDLCLCHAPGGDCVHVSMNFMLGEVGKKSVSERAYKTPLHAYILCGGLSDSIGHHFFPVSGQSLSLLCGREHFTHERPQHPICRAPEDVFPCLL